MSKYRFTGPYIDLACLNSRLHQSYKENNNFLDAAYKQRLRADLRMSFRKIAKSARVFLKTCYTLHAFKFFIIDLKN